MLEVSTLHVEYFTESSIRTRDDDSVSCQIQEPFEPRFDLDDWDLDRSTQSLRPARLGSRYLRWPVSPY